MSTRAPQDGVAKSATAPSLDLSVIICTWNNADRLNICLNALVECTVPDDVRWEIVLVNNNCTDKTDAVVARAAEQLPIVYIYEPKQGLSHARNAGIGACSGRLIVFTDDDVRPDRNWLLEYWNAYDSDQNHHFWGGPVTSEFEVEPDPELLGFAPYSVKGLDWGEEARVLPATQSWFLAANWACPSDALAKAGGFDPKLGLNAGAKQIRTGEETDLMRRLASAGWMPMYLPGAKLTHFVPKEKVSARHIGQRWQAYHYFRAYRNDDVPLGSKRLFGAPVWMYRQLLTAGLKLVWSRVCGDHGIRQYMTMREYAGRVQATRHRWRSRYASRPVAEQGKS